LRVILYHAGRNINRAVRTCFTFGVDDLVVVGPGRLSGNLFAARDRVRITYADALPDLSNAVALENFYKTPLGDVDWTGIDALLLGGESRSLPGRISPRYKATIPTANSFCLTVEAALAISLYEWSMS